MALQFFSLHTRRRRLSETGYSACFLENISPAYTDTVC